MTIRTFIYVSKDNSQKFYSCANASIIGNVLQKKKEKFYKGKKRKQMLNKYVENNDFAYTTLLEKARTCDLFCILIIINNNIFIFIALLSTIKGGLKALY